MRLSAICGLTVLVACGGGEGASQDTVDTSIVEISDDAADTSIVEISDDAADTSIVEISDGAEVGDSDDAGAASYCERSVEMFCGYYLRCGRMVAESLDECRQVFLETCNARYEPLYLDLERRGDLYLSKAGLDRCAAHLETVVCERQVFDLDGCPDVWVGRHAVGEPCGPGLESFVCVEDAVCVLDLSFCGTCKAKAQSGAGCDLDKRCDETEQCIDGTCVARPMGGEVCSEGGPPCAVGTDCVDGVCRGPTLVGEGEACGGARRCPYRSQCAGGVCVRTELVGEPCGGQVGCASGHCSDGECQPLLSAGEACGGPSQCVSGRCANTDDLCAPITWSCVP
ncbi:MAG TPA: hypothetical protein PK095_25205 [Myxococcota bacterium]|nr:hypothetical protein [Myxococcota bacterium]